MKTTPASERFVTIAAVYSPSDLAILLSLFAHTDILVQTVGRGHASVDLALTTALGGVALRVHEEDCEAARAMLTEIGPPHRGPALTGSWPIDLAFFALLLWFGAAPPPRQLPWFAIETAAVRRE